MQKDNYDILNINIFVLRSLVKDLRSISMDTTDDSDSGVVINESDFKVSLLEVYQWRQQMILIAELLLMSQISRLVY